MLGSCSPGRTETFIRSEWFKIMLEGWSPVRTANCYTWCTISNNVSVLETNSYCNLLFVVYIFP